MADSYSEYLKRRRKNTKPLDRDDSMFDLEEKAVGAGERYDVNNPTATNYTSSGEAAAKTIAAGGTAGDIVSSAAIASGNPGVMAGGLALATISQSRKKREAQANLEYEAKVNRQKRTADALFKAASNMNQMRV